MTSREKPRRRNSNRAEGFDYAGAGWYYVTICTHKLRPMFGGVIDGEMRLNAFGRVVEEEWLQSAVVRHNVDLDAYIVMPNHIHGIITISEEIDLSVRATGSVALSAQPSLEDPLNVSARPAAGPDGPGATEPVARTKLAIGPKKGSIGAIMAQFKSVSSKRINALRETPGAPVWHRNYYDHIIRNDNDLDRIRAYIDGNPGNWQYDRANRMCR